MKILTKKSNLDTLFKEREISQEKLIFIPTMGALHKGHISLVNEAKKIQENIKKNHLSGKILVSIFINPTQFQSGGDSEDFKKYPQTLESDIKKLEISGVDYLFLPEISEIYPEKKYQDDVFSPPNYILPDVFSELEGKTRKGHFEGVFQVVYRLFELVRPDYAIFGQKDFQQVMLIQYLQKKYFPEIQIITAHLFREKSGLAYSSRNMRFTQKEKTRAIILYKALSEMRKLFYEKGAEGRYPISSFLKKAGRRILESDTLIQKIHYISIRDMRTFREISEKKSPQQGDIILLSVEFSGIHLIDNMII